MVVKGAFRALICLAMIFLSFNASDDSNCIKSSYENIFSNGDESSDVFIMFSTKGKINIASLGNTLLWELGLSHPLISTTINIKKINFDELNILPGDDGRLYLIHSKSDTFQLINTTIPELVKKSPIASKYLPNVLFRGKEKIKKYTIDLNKGSLVSSTSSALSLHQHCLNHMSSISFERVDYILQSVINSSFIAWNATYSVINIISSIPYEEYYHVYYKSDYEIFQQFGEEFQYIYKCIDRNRKCLLMSDQLKANVNYDALLKPHQTNETHLYALCFIILFVIVLSIIFTIGLSMKVKDINNSKSEINITQMIPYKKTTIDTGSDDTISHLSTGSRIAGNKNKTKELKRRNSFSYKDIKYYCCSQKEKNEKVNSMNKKEDYYEPFHRESAPEFSLPLSKDKNSNEYLKNSTNNDPLKEKLNNNNEESNEEELSPNKIYTMKKITSIIIDKPKSVRPFQLEDISEAGNPLERRTTYNRSRQPSDSFHNSKRKYILSKEEKSKLKKLNTKYLQDIKKYSSNTICQINKCDTNSQKYDQIYKIINNSSSASDGHNANEGQTEDNNQLLDEMIQYTRFSQMCDTGRFITNFDDIQLIGKGGFGSVFKAMHKIDDCYYAIKIIKFSVGIEEDISKISEVQEIKTMMKVEHKNIVRYITCWFEFKDLNIVSNKKVRSLSMEDIPISKTITKRSQGFHNNNKSSNNHLCEFELVVKDYDYIEQKSNEFENIIFNNEGKPKIYFDNKDKDNDDDDNIIFGDSDDPDNSKDDDSGNGDDDYCPFDHNSNKNSEKIVIDKQNKKIILTYPVYFYMQMEYCDGFPLSYYLENRSTTLPEGLIVHIFRQISIAVQHIHNKKIIHRDLKPANIFIHGQFKVKIGDFGLAAEIDQSHREKVGTFLYQSPEQMEGKAYNEKVDIYALGLILLEMCLFFNTESERRITLMNVRKMIYPSQISLMEFKTEMSLAKKMTHKNPSIRPSITDVINSKEMLEKI